MARALLRATPAAEVEPHVLPVRRFADLASAIVRVVDGRLVVLPVARSRATTTMAPWTALLSVLPAAATITGARLELSAMQPALDAFSNKENNMLWAIGGMMVGLIVGAGLLAWALARKIRSGVGQAFGWPSPPWWKFWR